MHKPTRSTWIVTAFFLLTFFSAGGATVESFVNYPTWLLIGPDEFQAYHQALGPKIVFTMVVPFLLSTLFNIVLFWHRPQRITRWTVWATLLLAIMGWISTAAIQIPIQIQLSTTGFSEEAIERLITSDLWLRSIPGYVRLGIVIWMMHTCLKSRVKILAAHQ
jgi:amino acid transporter